MRFSQLEWARNEIEIILKEVGDAPNARMVAAGYKKALEAFEVLADESDIGSSAGVTKDALIRLMNLKPLTPITNNDEDWTQDTGQPDRDRISFRHRRLSSLYKYVYRDGTIEYADLKRTILLKEGSTLAWFSSMADTLVDEMFPIKFPYNPDNHPYVVRSTDFMAYEDQVDDDDFDTVWYHDITEPNGTVHSIDRYFGFTSKGWSELTKGEFRIRLDACQKRKEQIKMEEK